MRKISNCLMQRLFIAFLAEPDTESAGFIQGIGLLQHIVGFVDSDGRDHAVLPETEQIQNLSY